MNLKYIIIVLAIATSLQNVNAQNTKNYSIDHTSKISENKFKFLKLEKAINAQKIEIEKLKIEKDFYESNLASQTTIFSTITALFALLFGFLTYRGLKWEFAKHKKEHKSALAEIDKKTDELRSTITTYNNKHHYNSGNLNMLIYVYYQKEPVPAFKHCLRAVREFSKSNDIKYEETIRTLNFANNSLDKISKSQTDEEFFEFSDKILFELIKIENSSLQKIVADIIVKIEALK